TRRANQGYISNIPKLRKPSIAHNGSSRTPAITVCAEAAPHPDPLRASFARLAAVRNGEGAQRRSLFDLKTPTHELASALSGAMQQCDLTVGDIAFDPLQTSWPSRRAVRPAPLVQLKLSINPRLHLTLAVAG